MPRARGLDRRAFLRTGVLGLASVYAASKIDWTRAYEAAVAEGASPANQVVMIFLNGGNDGLNTIVPIADYAAYTAARPNLARAQGPSVAGPGGRVGSTVMLGTGGAHAWANVGVSGVGNNNDTKGFDTLWGDGSGGATSDLAVWPAADYTPANRSHFDSRDYWFAGALQKMTTGWLGRWLDLYGSTDNPLQAVSIDSTSAAQVIGLQLAIDISKIAARGVVVLDTAGRHREAGSRQSPGNVARRRSATRATGARRRRHRARRRAQRRARG